MTSQATADLGRRRWWGLAVITLSMVVIGLDTTVLNVALPTLAADLHASTGDLQWIVDSYVLVLAALMLPAGALGDRYGRREWLIGGLVLFGAASAMAAWAGSIGVLIAARVLLGVGAAVLTPLGMSMIPSMFPPEERQRAVVVLSVGMMLGLPIGPLLGGYLLDSYWWGSIFLINVPISICAAVASALLLPPSRSATIRRADTAGAGLALIGIGTLVYGLIEAPTHGWGGIRTLLGLGVGLVLLTGFALVETRIAQPMLDLRLFGDPRFRTATIGVSLVGMALFGLLFVLPQYLQVIGGNNAFGTGLRLLPMIGGMLVGGAASDRLTSRISARVGIAVGFLVLAVGLGVGSRVTAGSGYGLLAVSLTIVGVGFGIAMPTTLDVIMEALPKDDTGVGVAVATTLRMVAGAFGVALLPSVLSSVYTGRVGDTASTALAGLPANLASAATSAATDSVAGAAQVANQLSTQGFGTAAAALRSGAFTAFTDGMSLVLVICAATALIGAAVVAAFLPARPPEPDRGEGQPVEPDQVAPAAPAAPAAPVG